MACSIKNGDMFKMVANDFDKASSMAINKATRTTVVRMNTVITDKYNIKKKDIKSKEKIVKSTKTRKESQIIITHKPLGLIYFGARPTNKGVTYSIVKGKRLLAAHAFILNIHRKGNKIEDTGEKQQVFIRYGEKVLATKKSWKGKKSTILRQRIRVLTGMSIAQLFLGKRGTDMYKELQTTFNERVRVELLQASKYLIGKR